MSLIRKWYNALPSFFKKDSSLGYLNIAQFTVVLIDNIFKLVVAFFLIDTLGKEKAGPILSLVGAIYVIPFLLFSSIGGNLADRFSKQSITLAIKILETAIIFFSLFVFYFKSSVGAYAILFLLATQSAFFGPSKYGIISDLVTKDRVPKANSLITSFTYLAIIVGTFLGSFLTELTDHNFILIAAITFLISILGIYAACKIKHTPPAGSKQKLKGFFLIEIFQTLNYAKTKPHLILAIIGSSFFLFIGAFTQLNIIPYAIQAMKLNEVAGGYLFLSTALGIAIGASIAGKLCKKRVDLKLPLIAGFGMSLFLLFLAFSSSSILWTTTSLVLLGICGGIFIIPLDSYTQTISGNEKRGKVIGTSNFFQFTGVLLASTFLFIFSEILHLNALIGFFVMGILSFLFTLFLMLNLSDITLFILSKAYLNPFRKILLEKEELLQKKGSSLLITSHHRFKDLATLSYFKARIFFIAPEGLLKLPPFLKPLLGCIKYVDKHSTLEERLTLAQEIVNPDTLVCVVIEDNFSLYGLEKKKSWLDCFKLNTQELLYLDVPYSRPSELTLVFSSLNYAKK